MKTALGDFYFLIVSGDIADKLFDIIIIDQGTDRDRDKQVISAGACNLVAAATDA